MHKTGNLHPLRLSVFSNRLRSLQQMFNLRQFRLGRMLEAVNYRQVQLTHVRVRIIHQRIKFRHRFPDSYT